MNTGVKFKVARCTTVVSAFALLLLASGCGHPWFKNRWAWKEKPEPDQQPVLTDSAGRTYYPGTPSWVPLIDACMNAGGSRSECIAALPPEELAKLEAWEAEQGARRRSWMAQRRALNQPFATRNFGYFHVDLPDGWLVRIEKPGEAGWSDQVVVAHPAGIGSLRLRSFVAPGPVSHERLRNLTNVDAEIALQVGQWGDYAGFHYTHVEGDKYFRQWTLAEGNTVVLVSYQCPSELEGVETDIIDMIVGSLRVKEERAGNLGSE